MCITRQLGHKFKLTVDDFFDPFSQKPLYVERVVECRYVSSATKNFGVSQILYIPSSVKITFVLRKRCGKLFFFSQWHVLRVVFYSYRRINYLDPILLDLFWTQPCRRSKSTPAGWWKDRRFLPNNFGGGCRSVAPWSRRMCRREHSAPAGSRIEKIEKFKHRRARACPPKILTSLCTPSRINSKSFIPALEFGKPPWDLRHSWPPNPTKIT